MVRTVVESMYSFIGKKACAERAVLDGDKIYP